MKTNLSPNIINNPINYLILGAGGPHDMLFCRSIHQHSVQQPEGMKFQNIILNVNNHLVPPPFPYLLPEGISFKFVVIIAQRLLFNNKTFIVNRTGQGNTGISVLGPFYMSLSAA